MGYWVAVDYDVEGATRHAWFGYGSYNVSEITDAIELAITELLDHRP